MQPVNKKVLVKKIEEEEVKVGEIILIGDNPTSDPTYEIIAIAKDIPAKELAYKVGDKVYIVPYGKHTLRDGEVSYFAIPYTDVIAIV